MTSITGSLTINVYHQVADGKEKQVLTFGPIVAPSTVLDSSLTGAINARLRIEAIYTGTCTYEVYVRAIDGIGATSSGVQHVIVDNVPLPVTIVGPTGSSVQSMFSEALSVASSASQDILTYTVPPATTSYLLRAEMSGTNIATYDVLINGVEFARYRTYWSGSFVGTIEIGESPEDGYQVATGDIVTIRVTNFRPTSGDFEARLQYIEAT